MENKALLFMGGLPRIFYAMGTALVLENRMEFDEIIGVSMGIIVGLFFERKQTKQLFKKLLGMLLLDKPYQKARLLFDAAAFIDYMEIDDWIESSRVKAVLTSLDGETHILPLSKGVLLASMAVPGVTCESPIMIHGRAYIDGAINPLPIQEIVDIVHPAELCVLPNRPQRSPINNLSPVLLYWGIRVSLRMPHSVQWQWLSRARQFDAAVKTADDQGIKLNIIWPKGPKLKTFEKDPDVLLLAAASAAEETFRAFKMEPIPFLELLQTDEPYFG